MADSTDASPTGDPHIAQSEQAEIEARRAAKAARLFDIRRLIGGLFLIYGLILVVLGLGESDASIEKSAGMNVNLWSGLGMLVLSALFIAWGLLRPLSAEPDSEEAGGEAGGDGGGTGRPSDGGG
jgi:hypothetical protein